MTSKKPVSQVQKFRDTARKLEASEDEAAFDQVLKRVAKATPPKDQKAQLKKPGTKPGR